MCVCVVLFNYPFGDIILVSKKSSVISRGFEGSRVMVGVRS